MAVSRRTLFPCSSCRSLRRRFRLQRTAAQTPPRANPAAAPALTRSCHDSLRFGFHSVEVISAIALIIGILLSARAGARRQRSAIRAGDASSIDRTSARRYCKMRRTALSVTLRRTCCRTQTVQRAMLRAALLPKQSLTLAKAVSGLEETRRRSSWDAGAAPECDGGPRCQARPPSPNLPEERDGT